MNNAVKLTNNAVKVMNNAVTIMNNAVKTAHHPRPGETEDTHRLRPATQTGPPLPSKARPSSPRTLRKTLNLSFTNYQISLINSSLLA